MDVPITHLLRVVSDQGGRMIVERAPINPDPVSFSMAFLGFGLLCLAIYLARSRRWWLLVVPAIGFIALVATSKPDKACDITIDRNQGTVVWQTLVHGDEVASSKDSVADLSAAKVQSSMSSARLLLVRKDGATEFPLGENYLPDESVQYKIAHEIQQMIDQAQAKTQVQAKVQTQKRVQIQAKVQILAKTQTVMAGE